MKTRSKKVVITAALIIATCGAAKAASLNSAGYSQNFDSMGQTTSGTVLPTDWTVWSISGGHETFTTSIPAGSISGGTAVTTTKSALLDSAITSSIKSATTIYNVAHAATPTDRVLATSPTGNAAEAIQLSLTNNTGGALNGFNISYDMVKFASGKGQDASPYQEDLPGYQLFYSVNGGAYTNVEVLNPVRTADGIHPVVPNGPNATSGTWSLDYNVTSVSNAYVSLTTELLAGQSLTLRWVDDNGVTISPDQFIGIDNVSVSAVPIPAAAWLLGSSLLGLVGIRRKQK